MDSGPGSADETDAAEHRPLPFSIAYRMTGLPRDQDELERWTRRPSKASIRLWESRPPRSRPGATVSTLCYHPNNSRFSVRGALDSSLFRLWCVVSTLDRALRIQQLDRTARLASHSLRREAGGLIARSVS
jgi:hypothetical protein